MTTNRTSETSATELTTAADLTPLQIQAVTAILNQVIATTTALYLKTKRNGCPGFPDDPAPVAGYQNPGSVAARGTYRE